MKRILILLLCLLLPLGALAEEQIITITVAGDTLLGSNEAVRTQDFAFQRYIEQYGYAYPFEKLQGLMANDDITLVNLEVSLNNYVKPDLSRLIFRGPPEYARILTEGSVEIANLANNHTDDYLGAGYDATVAALEAEGILYCGDTEFGRELCWVDFPDGVRVGFIGIFPLYYERNEWAVQTDFQRLRDAGCDVIIASLHCGIENQRTRSEIQERLGRICIENGAHVIVGHHPHVPHGLIVRDGVTQLLSLGNFSFGGNTGVDEELTCLEGLVAQIHLHFVDGVYTGHQVTLWPIHISGTSPANNYQPVLVEGAEAQRIMQILQNDTDFPLNPYIDGEGAVQDFVPWPAP